MSIGGYTDNFSIPLSNFDTPTWIDEDWQRWRIIDAIFVAQNTGDVPFAVATGAANAFVVTYSPAITSYVPGKTYSFRANNAVTGAATVNVNGLGAKALKMNGEDPEFGDIPNNSYVQAIYDGTNFSVISPKKLILGDLNVSTGPSGATPNAETDFYVESSGPTYLELLGPNASTQGMMFSRPSLTYAGGIKYDHINNLMILRVNGSDVWSCNAAGDVTATKFIGALQGNLVGNVTGNVTGSADTWTTARTLTLGTDASGNVSFNGSANFTLNLTIVNNAITNAKLADMATATFKGRTTAGTGDPEDLTVTQATAMLNAVVGDTGTGGAKGLAPAPGANSAANGLVLKASGAYGHAGVAVGAFAGASGANVGTPFNCSCSRSSTGVYVITFGTALPSTDYAIFVTPFALQFVVWCITAKSASSFQVEVKEVGALTAYDPSQIFVRVEMLA